MQKITPSIFKIEKEKNKASLFQNNLSPTILRMKNQASKYLYFRTEIRAYYYKTDNRKQIKLKEIDGNKLA